MPVALSLSSPAGRAAQPLGLTAKNCELAWSYYNVKMRSVPGQAGHLFFAYYGR